MLASGPACKAEHTQQGIQSGAKKKKKKVSFWQALALGRVSGGGSVRAHQTRAEFLNLEPKLLMATFSKEADCLEPR